MLLFLVHHLHTKRRGTTLIEMLGVLIIFTIILGVAGMSVSRGIKRSNRDDVSNQLSVYSIGISDAYYDLGAPEFAPADPDAKDEFKRYLQLMESDYLGVVFDYDTLAATDTGFEIEISSPMDVYESRYHCWFVTDESIMKYAMIASGGDNGKLDTDRYAQQDYGDDIVLVVKPKV